MFIIDALRRWIGKMLPKQSIEQKLRIRIATSGVMDEAILRWFNMYRNQPSWRGGVNKTQCLNLPAAIAEELARLVLTEFQMNLGGQSDADKVYDNIYNVADAVRRDDNDPNRNDERDGDKKPNRTISERAAFIRKQLDSFLRNMSVSVELWCALGGVALKPYAAGENPETGNPDQIKIDVIPANRFFPTAFNGNHEITGAVFLDTRSVGDYFYTRLEYHNLSNGHYTIVNKAYRSERVQTDAEQRTMTDLTFQHEISLESVDEWRGISPVIELEGVEKPLFVYIRTPRANNIEPDSPLGASVFARAENAIQEADILYTRILWEYQAKEVCVQADESLFDRGPDGRPILPEGEERIYRTFHFDNAGKGDKGGLLNVYSPEIRDASMFNGLNKLYRNIEFLCGLAYGTLSDINFSSNAEKTATEIKYSKQRSYTTVQAMQKAWEDGLFNLLQVMNTLCDLYHMVPPGELEPVITWGDGVLEDTDIEYQRRWTMVMAGKLRLEAFYAWYFGCSEETAVKTLIPGQTSYPPEE